MQATVVANNNAKNKYFMFLKIFEFIVYFWDLFRFFWIIEQYSKGIVLRLGKFHKVLEPGFHWKLPFFDTVIETVVVTTTMRLSCQSLHTKDDKPIVVEAVVKYNISDIKVLTLEVYDALDAIGDMIQSIIKEIIIERDWSEIRTSDLDALITKKSRIEAKRWGIAVEKVTLITLSESPSLRLIGATPPPLP